MSNNNPDLTYQAMVEVNTNAPAVREKTAAMISIYALKGRVPERWMLDMYTIACAVMDDRGL